MQTAEYQHEWGGTPERIGRVVAQPTVPLCVQSMQCLCACHAAGLDASEPCNTDEDRAREIAIEYDCA